MFSSPFLSCALSCGWMDDGLLWMCSGFGQVEFCFHLGRSTYKAQGPKKTQKICFQHLEQIFMRCKKVLFRYLKAFLKSLKKFIIYIKKYVIYEF